MKKYIIGGFVGFMLATAVSVNAEGVTKLIDQVVQGVFPVTVEGNSVGDAIVVDNKTYLPVREFGEAVGYKVTFTEDREVVLTKNTDVVTPEKPVVVPPQESAADQIVKLNNQIKDLKSGIEKTENLKQVNMDSLKNPKTPQDEVNKVISELNDQLVDLKAKLSEYEAQLTALESQK